MSGTPKFKVYDAHGEYQAATKHPEDAACLVALYGDGATIRYEHSRVVWREGSEEIEAGESYDVVAQTVIDRIEAINRAGYERAYGSAPENYALIKGGFPGEWLVARVTRANKRHVWVETNAGVAWREIRSRVETFPTEERATAERDDRETAFREFCKAHGRTPAHS